MAEISPELADAIQRAVQTHGSVAKAARYTGVSWHTANRYAAPAESMASVATMPSAAPGVTPELVAAVMRQLGMGNAPEAPESTAAPRNGLVLAPRPYARVLWMSDLHIPYHDRRAIDAALDYARDWRPDLIIVGGDLYDCYGISRWEKQPERLMDSLQREFDAGKPVVRAIDAIGSDVVFLEGNHDYRVSALVAANPALMGLRALSWQRLAELPESWTIYPDQTRYRLGSLDFLHGNLKGRGGGAKHVASGMYAALKRSCLFGHHHRSQAHIDPDGDGTPRGGFAIGHLADTHQADYITSPAWNSGFASVEFDHEANLFAVHQHVICEGKFRANGKTYSG